MNRTLVAYGKQDIRIRDPYDQRFIALIIRQNFSRTNKNSKLKKLKYEFRRNYTKWSFFYALLETGLYDDFQAIIGASPAKELTE